MWVHFFQSDLPAGKLCTTLPIVPKSRDSWSTFGVWHKHIHSYSSQWIIILWTELPKYCLKNRLKMFNFWGFFCSQMFIRWPLVVASFTNTTTIICRVVFDENDIFQSEFFWYQSRITSTRYLFGCTEIIKISAKNIEFQEILKNCLPLNRVMKLMRSWIFLIPTWWNKRTHKLIFKAHVNFLILQNPWLYNQVFFRQWFKIELEIPL